MTAVDLVKYVFDFAFSGFWHFIGVWALIGAFRLFSFTNWK